MKIGKRNLSKIVKCPPLPILPGDVQKMTCRKCGYAAPEFTWNEGQDEIYLADCNKCGWLAWDIVVERQ